MKQTQSTSKQERKEKKMMEDNEEETEWGKKTKVFFALFCSNYILFILGFMFQSEILINLIFLTLSLTGGFGIISMYIEVRKEMQRRKELHL